MNKNTIATIVTGILGVLTIVGLFSLAKTYQPNETVTLPIIFEEYADLQCPACGIYYPAVLKVKNYYTDNSEVQFVFRNYPLIQIHPEAYNASLAAESARNQGKFYEYVERVFKENAAASDSTYLSQVNLEKYALELGLDVEKFKKDQRSEEVENRLKDDIARGDAAGIAGTPTFIINGKKYSVPQSKINGTTLEEQQQQIADEMIRYIDSKIELAKSQAK